MVFIFTTRKDTRCSRSSRRTSGRQRDKAVRDECDGQPDPYGDDARTGKMADEDKTRCSVAAAGFIGQEICLFCAAEVLATVMRESMDRRPWLEDNETAPPIKNHPRPDLGVSEKVEAMAWTFNNAGVDVPCTGGAASAEEFFRRDERLFGGIFEVARLLEIKNAWCQLLDHQRHNSCLSGNDVLARTVRWCWRR